MRSQSILSALFGVIAIATIAQAARNPCMASSCAACTRKSSRGCVWQPAAPAGQRCTRGCLLQDTLCFQKRDQCPSLKNCEKFTGCSECTGYGCTWQGGENGTKGMCSHNCGFMDISCYRKANKCPAAPIKPSATTCRTPQTCTQCTKLGCSWQWGGQNPAEGMCSFNCGLMDISCQKNATKCPAPTRATCANATTCNGCSDLGCTWQYSGNVKKGTCTVNCDLMDIGCLKDLACPAKPSPTVCQTYDNCMTCMDYGCTWQYTPDAPSSVKGMCSHKCNILDIACVEESSMKCPNRAPQPFF